MNKKVIASIVLVVIIVGLVYQNFNPPHKEVQAIPSDTLPIIDHGTNNIIVEIKGEVLYPGIYIMQQNARMYQLVELAGGFTKNAKCGKT
jgi:DNA uptake protein ComE-like DNA-binding protein